MRTLACNYLEIHQEHFSPFAEDYQKELQEILTMGKEASNLAIGPLQVVLQGKIETESINREQKDVENFNQMSVGGGTFVKICILYKRGHYDLIYGSWTNAADGFDVMNQQWVQPQCQNEKGLVDDLYVTLPAVQEPVPYDINAQLVQHLVDMPFRNT